MAGAKRRKLRIILAHREPGSGKHEPEEESPRNVLSPLRFVADRAFARAAGPPLAEAELPGRENLPLAGTVALRVIASEPSTAGLYRLDTLIAAGARRSLWLTDAYFVGTTTYIQALVAAAKDEVDVRLLVPGSSDLVLIRALSRAGYRPLYRRGSARVRVE